MQRFYVLLDGEITQEKTEASIRKHMAPHPVDFTHVEWFSKFESERSDKICETLVTNGSNSQGTRSIDLLASHTLRTVHTSRRCSTRPLC